MSDALEVDVEVSARWRKAHGGVFDRGGGCIEPPSSGEWGELTAEVDGQEFALDAEEEERAFDVLAGEPDDYDPRDDRDDDRFFDEEVRS
ncbi:MAG: hypothetical protein FJ298_14245 [Planctomycetes bacterium]|nr:hypothetical protein [Planctomycetota bacterium]